MRNFLRYFLTDVHKTSQMYNGISTTTPHNLGQLTVDCDEG